MKGTAAVVAAVQSMFPFRSAYTRGLLHRQFSSCDMLGFAKTFVVRTKFCPRNMMHEIQLV